MNQYFIKINRKSVYENVNVGNTKTVVPGIVETKVSFCIKFSNEVKDIMWKKGWGFYHGPSILEVRFMIQNFTRKMYNFLIRYNKNTYKIFKKLIKNKNAFVVSIGGADGYEGIIIDEDRNIQTLRHEPEQQYFSQYKKTKVQCNECGSKFIHSKLDWELTCPVCDMPDCCEVEYEQIEDIIGVIK